MSYLTIGTLIAVICYAICIGFLWYGGRECQLDYYASIGRRFLGIGILVLVLVGIYGCYDGHKEKEEMLTRLEIAVDDGYSLFIDNIPVGSLDRDFIEAAPGKYDIIFDDAGKQVVFK